MRLSLLKTATLATALLAGQSASAVTFDFTTLPELDTIESQDYTSEGITVTATVGANFQSESPVQLKVGTSPAATTDAVGFYRGLGAVSLDNLDGSLNAGEYISFSLPEDYTVHSVTLTRTGPRGQAFTLLLDGMGIGSGSVETANNVVTDGRTTFRTTRRETGSLFIVESDDDNDGGVWINSLVLVPAVPLPAGAGLLGGALAMGATLSRRKRKQS